MRYIYPDIIDSVSADEAAASWPVANVQDDHPQNPWRATSHDAQLKLTVDDRADCFALAATNAISMTVTIKDETETTTLWGPVTYDMTGILDWYQWFTQSGIQQSVILVEYTEQESAHVIVLDLAADPDDDLEVGVARAGILHAVDAPGWGFEEYLVDHSTKKELASGAVQYTKGNIVSGFRMELFAHRTDTFWVVMRQLAKQIGETPLFFQVATLDSPNWTLFGHFNGMPAGDHSTLSYSLLRLDIMESV